MGDGRGDVPLAAGGVFEMTASGGGFPDQLSEPAQRALASAGFTRLEELTTVSEAELAKLHGMGPKAIRQLRDALSERSLAFAPKN